MIAAVGCVDPIDHTELVIILTGVMLICTFWLVSNMRR
jgi:hypothetical protein